MDNSSVHFTPIRLAQKFLALAWTVVLLLVLSAGLIACDRRPGSSPATSGSGDTGRGRAEEGAAPSSSVEVRTPTAPDTRGGGSGFKGMPPTPDTSGGPSSGSNSPGASSSNSAPASSATGSR